MLAGLLSAVFASICYGSASVLEAVAARRAAGPQDLVAWQFLTKVAGR